MSRYNFNNGTILFLYTFKTNSAPFIINSKRVLEQFFYPSSIKVEKDQFGKPFLKNSHYHISVSHTKDLIVCVLSKNKVGVDAEVNRPISSKTFEFINRLFSFKYSVKSLQDWTKIEAFIKVQGLKINHLIKPSIEVRPLEQFYYKQINNFHNFYVTIASESPIAHVEYQQINFSK